MLYFRRTAMISIAALLFSSCTDNIHMSSLPAQNIAIAAVNQTSNAGGAWSPMLVVGNQSGNASSVLVFTDAGKSFKRAVNVGPVIYGIAANDAGNVFVGSGSRDVQSGQVLGAYKDRGVKLVQTIKENRPFKNPTLDSSQNVYVICNERAVCEYPSAKGKLVGRKIVRRFTFGQTPQALAADSTGDIAVSVADGVEVFAPGATSPFWTVASHQLQGGIVFDSAGDLYVATGYHDSGVGLISVYASGESTPSRTFSDAEGPLATILSRDANNNLYAFTPTCSKCPAPAVAVFPFGSSAPTRVITKGIANFVDVVNMSVDRSGGVFIDDSGTESISGSLIVYAPNKVVPLRTISNGLQAPNFLATTPSAAVPRNSLQASRATGII
jgi:hypothetical protein